MREEDEDRKQCGYSCRPPTRSILHLLLLIAVFAGYSRSRPGGQADGSGHRTHGRTDNRAGQRLFAMGGWFTADSRLLALSSHNFIIYLC